MCRIAAFPPGFSRKKAIDILASMECANTDGFGFAYVKEGKHIIEKWPKAISKQLARNYKSVLNHMPFNEGWTIAHLRAASHGENTMNNTHPFQIGDWAMCHNGIWSDYDVVKLALSSFVKFKGETDTEVACHLINGIGPKKFASEIRGAGVFLCLHKNGELFVVRTSGDLVFDRRENKQFLVSSQLDREKYKEQGEGEHGWYHFAKDGTYIANKAIVQSFTGGHSYYHYPGRGGSGSRDMVGTGMASQQFHGGYGEFHGGWDD